MATFTITQYQTLVNAIAQGALTVKYADKEVDYMSLNDMLRLKKVMEIDLGIIQPGPKKTKAVFSKGLNYRGHYEEDFC